MDKNIKKQPLVSVIMPVYNGEKYLPEAIESILNQTYKNFELIIVNDGSTDNSIKIAMRYAKKDRRIKAFSNKQNLGISETLNKGLAHSKGKYIARLDCDDISLPDRLKEQVKILEENIKIGVCGTWAWAIDESGNKLQKMNTLSGLLLNYNYWKPSPFISSSSMVRKKIIQNIRYDRKLSTVEDYDMWLRLKNNHNFYNIRKRLVLYRLNSNGVSLRYFDRQRELSRMAFLKNIDLRNLSQDDYLSVVCLEFKMSYLKRFKYLIKLSKKIVYPWWMILLDNNYYLIRKMFRLNPFSIGTNVK